MVAEPVDQSEIGTANAALQRVNIPINVSVWKHLEIELQNELCWFHQHCLDCEMTLDETAEAIGYDRSVAFRVLKGTYNGSWENVIKAIRRYRTLTAKRGSIQQNEWVSTGIVRMIHAGLDYALANNSITIITGESRMGKTVAVNMWREENNHGTNVYMSCPPLGSVWDFCKRLGKAVGVKRTLCSSELVEAATRSFNRNRILIIDEAHRMLPSRSGMAKQLEIARDIHDETGCGLAFIGTHRFVDELKRGEYMYEQLTGRIGMPIQLPTAIKRPNYLPILKQYVARPSADLLKMCDRIVNEPGRLGILVENCKLASQIASKANTPLSEEHIRKAIAIRHQMSTGKIAN